jgi:membrane-associated phospholipid phosphatase
MAVVAIGLVVAGFAGLDPWILRHVSEVLDTKDNLTDRDFYSLTRPAWLVLRYAVGHLPAPLAVLIVAVVLDTGRWRRYVGAGSGILAAGLLANLLQGVIGRLRPNQAEHHLDFLPPFSQVFFKAEVCFPSGEAATALAVATVFARLYPRWSVLFYVLAALAAAARLVNGAHYFSDVVAGGVLGVVTSTLVFRAVAGRGDGGCGSVPTLT